MNAPLTSSRRFFWLAILGNCFEHYEGALFTLLSSYLAMALCPGKTAIDALISTYALIPLGVLARPIGAFIFGVIGDRYGRGTALCMTLCGMAFVSLCFSITLFGLTFFTSFFNGGGILHNGQKNVSIVFLENNQSFIHFV
jgi:MFS family permease